LDLVSILRYAIPPLVFDLDHTLWDFETNAKETLEDIFHANQLQERG